MNIIDNDTILDLLEKSVCEQLEWWINFKHCIQEDINCNDIIDNILQFNKEIPKQLPYDKGFVFTKFSKYSKHTQ